MSDIAVIVYFIGFAMVAGATFAFMWKLMSSTLDDFKKPIKKKSLHPELSDVNNGDELMVVKFESDFEEGTIDLKFTPDNKFNDTFLKKSFEKRMKEIEDEKE